MGGVWDADSQGCSTAPGREGESAELCSGVTGLRDKGRGSTNRVGSNNLLLLLMLLPLWQEALLLGYNRLLLHMLLRQVLFLLTLCLPAVSPLVAAWRQQDSRARRTSSTLPACSNHTRALTPSPVTRRAPAKDPPLEVRCRGVALGRGGGHTCSLGSSRGRGSGSSSGRGCSSSPCCPSMPCCCAHGGVPQAAVQLPHHVVQGLRIAAGPQHALPEVTLQALRRGGRAHGLELSQLL